MKLETKTAEREMMVKTTVVEKVYTLELTKEELSGLRAIAYRGYAEVTRFARNSLYRAPTDGDPELSGTVMSRIWDLSNSVRDDLKTS